MFSNSDFNKDISKWDVSRVKDMNSMFRHSKFNQNISSLKINKDCDTTNMFEDCPIRKEYKPVLPE